MDKLIGEFLDYLKYERYRSAHTVENYGADLTAFRDFVGTLEGDLSWETVDPDVIRCWMESMMDKGNTATSINRRLSSLRTFYRFALARGKVSHDPAYQVKGPKKAKPLPQYLREEEMTRLLDADFWTDKYKDVRARTIVLTFYSTGMRLSELVGLNDSSVDSGSSQIKVLGKRNKERIIPFGQELKDAIADYQERRNAELRVDTEALFLNDKGRRMTPEQVRREVQKAISKVSSMKKRSPHVLRHTFATAMLNNDSGLESVQKLLGHESIATTEIYTHTTFEQLRKAYEKAHPRGEEE